VQKVRSRDRCNREEAFAIKAMAHALRSTSLFSRILTSSTRPYAAAAASSKRALATAAHEHDDAGELFFPHFTPVLVPFPFSLHQPEFGGALQV
jgi:hypothetical protein